MKFMPPLVVALLLLPLTAIGNYIPSVRFLDNDLSEVRRMAAREGKLYFIHFTADWVMPCQWMENHTFKDEPLSEYVEENYLALRADIDIPEGQALKDQFEVHILPSILVFSSQGQLLGRHEGAMEPEVLLEKLKSYDRPANRMRATLAALDDNILASPKPIFSISRPALIPDEYASPGAEEGEAVIKPVTGVAVMPSRPSAGSAPALSSQPGPANAPSPEPQKPANIAPPYDKPTVQRVRFTIQVGVFSSYSNAVRHCTDLERQVSYQTEITPFQLNGQGLYKVFLGHFDNQEEAAAYLKNLRQKKIDGFVKILNNQPANPG